MEGMLRSPEHCNLEQVDFPVYIWCGFKTGRVRYSKAGQNDDLESFRTAESFSHVEYHGGSAKC